MPEFDLSTLLKQAQSLQDKLRQVHEEAAARTVEADSGGGMVRVVVDGGMQLRKIEIDPALLGADDKTMLEDLVIVAVNEGLRRAQQMVSEEVGRLGPFGGLKMPFPGGGE